MKRAITALALVGALLLSVVACQVYNPTNNETIYTAMRSEGPISWADYSKEYFDADIDGRCKILEEYETMRILFGDETKKETYLKGMEELNSAYEDKVKAYEEAVKKYEDILQKYNEAKAAGKTASITRFEGMIQDPNDANKGVYPDMLKAEKAVNDARDAILSDLKALWDKEYDVLWDWNSKM